MTEAVTVGLDRWLAEIEAALGGLEAAEPAERIRSAAAVIERTRDAHAGLARNFIGAIAKAPHDERVRGTLAAGFRRTRPAVAALLGLGDDEAAEDAAALVVAMFDGLLLQALLEPGLAVEGERMRGALGRLREALPGGRRGSAPA